MLTDTEVESSAVVSDVGRTGTTPVVVVVILSELPVVEEDLVLVTDVVVLLAEALDVLDAPEEVGQSVSPHWRSDRQQPPPRVTGQARYEEEQAKVV